MCHKKSCSRINIDYSSIRNTMGILTILNISLFITIGIIETQLIETCAGIKLK